MASYPNTRAYMHSSNHIAALPAALLAVLSAFPGAAQADDSESIETVVISGARAATKLSETSSAIGVADRNALQRDKPKTMGDVLNRIAGVYWNDLGNEQHSMGIRQPISTNAVYQYLEDGIPIRPLGVFNHNSLNEMNIAGSDAVEVVKGPASSLYGSNAVGGAINALTAAPSGTPYASAGARGKPSAATRATTRRSAMPGEISACAFPTTAHAAAGITGSNTAMETRIRSLCAPTMRCPAWRCCAPRWCAQTSIPP